MTFSITSLTCTVAFLFSLTACGGGGSSNGQEARDDRNLSGQNLSSTHTFFTKIIPESFTETNRLGLSQPLSGITRDAYLVSTLDQAKAFNDVLNPADRVSFNDLETTAYFLIKASDCPGGSIFAGSEHNNGQVSIKITRYDAAGTASCNQKTATQFHVFKASKLHAPEVLFETITGVPASITADNQAGTIVIGDLNTWSDYWTDRYSQWTTPPALPSIDFAQNVVVGVQLGSRPSGCYSVGIDRIYLTSGQNIVEYTEWTPPAEAMCTQAIIYPIHFVTAPKSVAFTFIRNQQTYSLP